MATKWFSKLIHPRLRATPNPPTPRPDSSPHRFDRVFSRFDSNGDGKISGDELRSSLVSTGDDVSVEWAEVAVEWLDSDGDGMVDYGDFVRLMEGTDGDDETLRRAFEMFEGEKGGGCITPGGLQRMLGRLGDARSYGDCAAMIRAYDLNGDGVLDYSEFHRMMA